MVSREGARLDEILDDGFDPDPEDYRPTDNFVRRLRSDLKGIFTGEVIESCFNGNPNRARNDCLMMVGELNDCYFGLIIDPEDRVVVDGNVLQVNPVQASIGDRWTGGAIDRMQSLAKNHRGKIWNAYKDPRIGNKDRWVPEREW